MRRATMAMCGLASVAMLGICAMNARADDEPPTTPEALFARASAEDDATDFARALADYREVVARFPSSRFAPKAATRAGTLIAHAEGAFAPYAELESVRRDPKRVADGATIEALARDADAFPDGPTRAEARMVCADAWMRASRRADAERALETVARDPSADALVRREAASELVRARLDDGDVDGARADVASLGSIVDAREAKNVTRVARRRWVHRACLADLAIVALLVALACARGRSRDVAAAMKRGAPVAIAFGAWIAFGGWLASAYESGNAAPFVVLGASLAPIAIAARAWSASGSPRAAARWGRAIACASAALATAFLVLELVDARYLEGFSL